jgi:hypothetical protein
LKGFENIIGVFLGLITRNYIGEVTSLLGDDLVYCGRGLEVNFDPVRLFGLDVGIRVQDSILGVKSWLLPYPWVGETGYFVGCSHLHECHFCISWRVCSFWLRSGYNHIRSEGGM